MLIEAILKAVSIKEIAIQTHKSTLVTLANLRLSTRINDFSQVDCFLSIFSLTSVIDSRTPYIHLSRNKKRCLYMSEIVVNLGYCFKRSEQEKCEKSETGSRMNKWKDNSDKRLVESIRKVVQRWHVFCRKRRDMWDKWWLGLSEILIVISTKSKSIYGISSKSVALIWKEMVKKVLNKLDSEIKLRLDDYKAITY